MGNGGAVLFRFSPEAIQDLDANAQAVVTLLLDLPLVAEDELVPISPCDENLTKAGLKNAAKLGLTDSQPLSYLRSKPVLRTSLNMTGLQSIDSPEPTWHHEGNLCELLARLPEVEAYYQLLGKVHGLRRFGSFNWLSGVEPGAAATFERGWCVFRYFGGRMSEADVRHRLSRIAIDILKLRDGPDVPWPNLFLFPTDGPWLEHLLRKTLRYFPRFIDRTFVWNAEADLPLDIWADPSKGSGAIHQPVWLRDTGNHPWQVRLETSPWAHNGSTAARKIMRLLNERGRVSKTMLKAEFREGPGGRGVQHTLKELMELGLVELYIPAETAEPEVNNSPVRDVGGTVAQDSQEGREGKVKKRRVSARVREKSYRLARKGAALMRRLNGAPVNRVMSTQRESDRRRKNEAKHERLLEVVEKAFKMAGYDTAEGLLSWDRYGHLGFIAPDAIVLLPDGQCIPVEVELSLSGEMGVKRKVLKYGRAVHQYPLFLVVARDDALERDIHTAGNSAERRLGIFTTTEARLKERGAFGQGTWSDYGVARTLRKTPDGRRLTPEERLLRRLVATLNFGGMKITADDKEGESHCDCGCVSPRYSLDFPTGINGIQEAHFLLDFRDLWKPGASKEVRHILQEHASRKLAILAVVRTIRAEKALQELGLDTVPTPFMLTTTRHRLEKHGAFGEETWSLYGEADCIGPYRLKIDPRILRGSGG